MHTPYDIINTMNDFMNDELTKEEIIAFIKANCGTREDILNILLEVQKASPKGFIDYDTAQVIADFLHMTYAEIYQIISFYDMLNTEPQAKFVLKICTSTPCYYSKSTEIASFLKDELGVDIGETTGDGMFSYHYIPCVGACDTGPVVVVKDAVYGNLSTGFLRELISGLRSGKRVT